MRETQRKTFHDANGRAITVTAWTIRGNAPGPVMTVIAGQHGMEHSGPCLLPEFAQEMEAGNFRGTLHIIPCANPPALEMDYEFYPEREDLSKIKDYYYSRFRHMKQVTTPPEAGKDIFLYTYIQILDRKPYAQNHH